MFEAGVCLNFQRLGFKNYTRNYGDRIRTVDIILVMLNKTIVDGNFLGGVLGYNLESGLAQLAS